MSQKLKEKPKPCRMNPPRPIMKETQKTGIPKLLPQQIKNPVSILKKPKLVEPAPVNQEKQKEPQPQNQEVEKVTQEVVQQKETSKVVEKTKEASVDSVRYEAKKLFYQQERNTVATYSIKEEISSCSSIVEKLQNELAQFNQMKEQIKADSEIKMQQIAQNEDNFKYTKDIFMQGEQFLKELQTKMKSVNFNSGEAMALQTDFSDYKLNHCERMKRAIGKNTKLVKELELLEKQNEDLGSAVVTEEMLSELEEMCQEIYEKTLLKPKELEILIAKYDDLKSRKDEELATKTAELNKIILEKHQINLSNELHLKETQFLQNRTQSLEKNHLEIKQKLSLFIEQNTEIDKTLNELQIELEKLELEKQNILEKQSEKMENLKLEWEEINKKFEEIKLEHESKIVDFNEKNQLFCDQITSNNVKSVSLEKEILKHEFELQNMTKDFQKKDQDFKTISQLGAQLQAETDDIIEKLNNEKHNLENLLKIKTQNELDVKSLQTRNEELMKLTDYKMSQLIYLQEKEKSLANKQSNDQKDIESLKTDVKLYKIKASRAKNNYNDWCNKHNNLKKIASKKGKPNVPVWPKSPKVTSTTSGGVAGSILKSPGGRKSPIPRKKVKFEGFSSLSSTESVIPGLTEDL